MTPPPPSPSEPDSRDLVAEGRSAYLGNCIACHNPDPKLEGALGPPVWGASEELLEARIMRQEYPPGYTPKRTTTSMIAMPFLERKISVIAAYLDDKG
jgi:mono/diheme cytochrome c family protein